MTDELGTDPKGGNNATPPSGTEFGPVERDGHKESETTLGKDANEQFGPSAPAESGIISAMENAQTKVEEEKKDLGE